ncbi:unnamed protein product [Malus baccata var. baccata]
MGLTRSESLMRWVWEANGGSPVGENATLTFGTDGNLVLADADGRVAWQTNTANKGVLYPQGGIPVLDVPKFNSTLTYLRLGIDGNIKLHTYYGAVDSWELTFTLFDRDSVWETECQLPSRCGEFGVCENNQCVACPLSNGLVGWNTSCVPEKLTSCDPKSFHYYKVEGVDYFLSKYTRGSSTKESDWYFYNKDTSRCWIAYDLETLTKVASPTHVAYIKAPNY